MLNNKLTLSPEGGPFVVSAMVAAILCGFFGWRTDLTPLLLLSVIFVTFSIFCFHFFRDPKRIPPEGETHILAPADGKVIFVGNIEYDPDMQTPARQISIFLSLFNVHANRMPVTGTITSISYRKGRFLAAFKEAASKVNEQTEIHIMTREHLVKVKQIAGILARRILCYLQEGDKVSSGYRFGFIRFGSRTDIVLPSEASILVTVGQKVVGGETIIGELM